ncbi:MAG TPA: SDR family oxidoreductase [Longimicrobiaceae bacterium]|nr:SDR family oxidoreductase [Longimicrobiaceae bacterium]
MSTTLTPPARARGEAAGAAPELAPAPAGAGVALVTGTSSGIGRATAERLARRGWRVYGGSRSTPAGETAFAPLVLDVDRDESVAEAVAGILAREGRIDAVVNAAGYGIAGAVEDTSVEEARAQFETNVLGVLRVVQAVLPGMRARRAGAIVNVSSIAGTVGVPFQGFYAASKFALEGMTESLRMELRPFGVRVMLIEPGDTVTRFRRVRTAASQVNETYREYCDRVLALTEAEEARGVPPERVARLIERVLRIRRPRLRYTEGPVMQRATPFLHAVLPHRVFEWLMCSHFKL